MSVDILSPIENWFSPSDKSDNITDLSQYDIRANNILDLKENDYIIDELKVSDDLKDLYQYDIRTNNILDLKESDDSMDELKTSDDSMDDINFPSDLKISDDSIDDISFPSKLQIVDQINSKKGIWYQGMYINNFSIYKITTTVMIVEINEKVNEKALFHLLPITKMILNKKRSSAKCDLPYCDILGSIIALKKEFEVRGIVKSEKGGFKHSISIDISTSVKNINVALSSLKMKISGSPSEDGKLGLEAAGLVIDHIINTQNMINKIKSNKDIAEKTISWIIKNTKGEKILRENIINSGKFMIHNEIEDFTIRYPMYFIPDELDIDIAKFLISLINDFAYHSDMCEKISSMLNVPDVINSSNNLLKIEHMNFVMVNYNYHLLFNINLEILDQCIHGKNNFYSHYNNDLSNCVTVELAYDPSINPAIKRKKNKVPRITFLCYKSGSVTHSGPGGLLMSESYYLFMITIAEIRHLIESK